MAQIDGGDLVARMLKREGIDTIFTLSGGHIQNIYDGCIDEGIRVIDTRHEQVAGHAAEGYSRLTRKCGVAVVTAGPGVTDTVTAVATAYQNASPLLVIGGAAPLRTSLMGALQEIPGTVEMMRPITKWAATIPFTNRIPDYLAQAFRIALTGRYGPVFLEIPSDILFGRLEEEQVRMPEGYRTEGKTQGDAALVAQAAQMLANAERPAVMGGTGVYWSDAGDALRELAEKVQAPIYLNDMGRGTVSQEHAQFRSRTRRTAFGEADVVLFAGTMMDFRLRYGGSVGPQAKIIAIDIDPNELGRNRGIDAGIEGDPKATLRAITAEIGARTIRHDEWLDKLRDGETKVLELRQKWLHSDASPIHPLRLCNEMAKFVDEKTIVVGDGGDIVATASQVLPVNQPGQFMGPGPLGTLGVGTGFCIAAKSVRPDAKVLMVNGDGSFGLNGFDFDTLVRFNMPVVAVVGNDRQWGQILVGQEKMYGEERVVATRLADNARYDKVVEALGGHGEFVTEPGDIFPAIERAFASGKPACVNVIIDQKPEGVAGGYEFLG
ncbi:MAG TPA: thiamine pyrophosphate-binding protein [Dehalococcoidia bacterium]|nr:thiamine pyrophosphate-binding protein [Dehalococcoidia bacterium]